MAGSQGGGVGKGVDRERLAKLLALAESNVDGEALAALRKAAEMLGRGGLRLRDLSSDAKKSGVDFCDLSSDAELYRARERIADLEAKLKAARAAAQADRDGVAQRLDDLEAQASMDQARRAAAETGAAHARQEAEAAQATIETLRRQIESAEIAREQAMAEADRLRAQLELAQARHAADDPDPTDVSGPRKRPPNPYASGPRGPADDDWRVARQEGDTPQYVRSQRRNLAV